MKRSDRVDFDVAFIGSGPLRVSAALPLDEAGLRVLTMDGGHRTNLTSPNGQFLDIGHSQNSQWRRMIGSNMYTFSYSDALSAKLSSKKRLNAPFLFIPIHSLHFMISSP